MKLFGISRSHTPFVIPSRRIEPTLGRANEAVEQEELHQLKVRFAAIRSEAERQIQALKGASPTQNAYAEENDDFSRRQRSLPFEEDTDDWLL